MNFHGIYNFEFNDSKDDISFNLKEKFDYQFGVEVELWNMKNDDCIRVMRRIRSYIYDKYLLVKQYGNDVLEGKNINFVI